MRSWQWLWDFERAAMAANDTARIHLAGLHREANRVGHDAPDQKLAIYEEGRGLAVQLREPWWEMFYEHWVIEVLLFGKQKPREALDRAVRAVFEVRKPIYDAFPQRVGLHMNLAAAYMGIDPIGYEKELRAVFPYIQSGCEQFPDFQAYYAQLWGYFLESIEDDGAVGAAWEYLFRAEETGSAHYIWDALHMLCSTLYRFEPEMARLQIGELATLGEELARVEKRNRGITSFLMWQAVAARWEGDETAAKRLYQRSWLMQSRLPVPRNSAHYPAIAFHEVGGDLESALKICQLSIRVLRQHELTFLEVQRRLKKCQLLGQLGRDFSRDAARLRSVADQLPSREHWEKRLLELEQGAPS